MKTILAISILCVGTAFDGWQWTNDVGQVQWSPAKPDGGYIAGSLYQVDSLQPHMVTNPQYAAYWWMRGLAENYLPWTNGVSPWPCSEVALIGGITAKIDQGWPETGCQADRAYVLAVWPQLPADLTVVPPAQVPQ